MPTTGDGRVVPAAWTSAAQCACTSPVSTTGLRTRASTQESTTRSRDAGIAVPGVRVEAARRRPGRGRAGRRTPAGPGRPSGPASGGSRRRASAPGAEPVHGAGRVGALGAVGPSPHGWSSRYCRVSSMWNVAGRPSRAAGRAGCPGRAGAARRAAACSPSRPGTPRRAAAEAAGRVSGLSRTSPAQLFSTSWSSKTTSHGRGGVRGLQVGVGVVDGVAAAGSPASVTASGPACRADGRSGARRRRRPPRRCSRRGAPPGPAAPAASRR